MITIDPIRRPSKRNVTIEDINELNEKIKDITIGGIPDKSITTDKVVDGAVTEAKLSQAIKDTINNKADMSVLNNFATKEKVKQMTETTASITPNILHVWGEVPELNITLADGEDDTVNEYMIQFTSGATATTLELPDNIQWMAAPIIQANKTYQLSIVNNLGIIGEWS